MKNINFKNIKIEGFGSFVEPNSFPLERGGGVNIVRGLNGAGKTTVFNALFWSLYGENLKGLVQSKLPTKKEYRNKKTWRGTRVALSLEVDEVPYIIIRHISFKGTTKGLEGGSSLMIFEEGELVGEELHKGDQKQFIIDLLGMDSRVFLNSILFGQRMKKFIEAKPDEKRKIFESIFDLDFIESAKEKAKEHKEYLEDDISELSLDISGWETKIESKSEQISNGEKILNNFEKDKKERLASIQAKIDEQKEKITEAKDLLKTRTREKSSLETNIGKISLEEFETKKIELSKWKDELSSLERKKRSANDEIITAKNKIQSLKEDLKNAKTTCPSCSQKLHKSKIDEVKKGFNDQIKIKEENLKAQENNLKLIEEEISKYSKIQELEKELESWGEKTKELEDLKKSLREVEGQISRYDETIKTRSETLQSYEKDYEKESEKQPPELNLEKLKIEIKELKEEIAENESLKVSKEEELEKTEWWIKKGFGASGLRSFVFNAMMAQLNKAIKKYASRLGFFVQFSIDMEKASKPFLTKCFTVDKIPMDYDEFSGGEKARIDVASAFAVHDLVSSNSNINILIMDEIFEGLDEDGIEDAFDLIRIKSEGRNLYIITHSKSIDSLNCKHIDISKENHNTIIG